MISRSIVVALIVVLSLQLALHPVAEATVAWSLAAAPAPEAAAEGKAQTKQQKRKKQAKRATPKKQRAKKANKGKQKRPKAKQQRNQHRQRQRADGATRVSTLGQTSVPRLPGGRLRSSEARGAQAQNLGERYIVIYRNDRVDSQALTMTLDQMPGVLPTNIFEHSLKGFAGVLTPAARDALERDPRVESVTRDRQAFLAAQTLPTGINRVDADLNSVAAIDGGGPGVNVDIAIIDTGTDLGHPDLNIFAYGDCASDPNSTNFGWDLNGHGTHVAGTAAAIDNGDGVVGVAPGARLWSMRVMDDSGIMFWSYIIDCMDLVSFYANSPFNGQTVDVANMSLGGRFNQDACNADPVNQAVCNMVAAGVTTVVAAGNDRDNAANHIPANIDAVITVSALADADGRSGGLGGGFRAVCNVSQTDDGLATFSNFGADVDIAAPGINVLSTFPTYINSNKCALNAGVGYEIYPGTSMASPHVAGAAGLLLAVNPNLTPAEVKAAMQGSRENVAMAGDPDGINEGILNLAPPRGGDTGKPRVTLNAPGSVRAGQRLTLRVQASDPSGIARVELYLCQRGCRKVAQDRTAPYSFVRRHGQAGPVRYKVRVFDRAGNVAEKSKVINIRRRQQ